MYHTYSESGLDNIVLANGFKVHTTPYGEAIAIDHPEALHKAIANNLVRRAHPLNGAELRFLRHELEFSQKQLANMFGIGEQALARWEKDRKKPLPGMADRLVRILYREHLEQQPALGETLERLMNAANVQSVPLRLRETSGEWAVDLAA